MTTTQRTDIHRPTEMDPQNYEYVAAFDNQTPWVLAGGDWAMEISRKIARDDRLDRSVFQCHHCGARLRYFAVLTYTPTGEYVVVGETCLDNRFSLVSKAAFDALREAAALDRKAQRIKTAAAAFVAELTDPTAKLALDRETDLAATFGLDGYGLSTVTDIRRKLWNSYGEISERQIAFVLRLIAEVPARAAAAAARAAEEDLKIPCPTGKVTIDVVVGRKWKDSEYGGSMKITLKCATPEGIFLVWMTEPRAIETERGDIVRVSVNITPSDSDPSFGFGKRPTKAEITGRAAVEADSLSD
jgi:hypothetical protein